LIRPQRSLQLPDTLDVTTLSLTATPNVAEGGSIVYTASLNNTAQTPVTLTLSNGANDHHRRRRFQRRGQRRGPQ